PSNCSDLRAPLSIDWHRPDAYEAKRQGDVFSHSFAKKWPRGIAGARPIAIEKTKDLGLERLVQLSRRYAERPELRRRLSSDDLCRRLPFGMAASVIAMHCAAGSRARKI